jgi:hypothetical protein
VLDEGCSVVPIEPVDIDPPELNGGGGAVRRSFGSFGIGAERLGTR